MTHDATDDSVRLAAGDAMLEIVPATGGALAAFTFRGSDVLRPTSADARAERNVRNHACYPLVPYSNRIAQARLRFNDRDYALVRNFGDHPHAIHGVGWQRPWRLDASDGASALLSLDYAPDGPGAGADQSEHRDGPTARSTPWPWAFRAWQSFALAPLPNGVRLTMRLTLLNVSEQAFPFGLGWHPFFPRSETTELGFTAQGVWETEATQLPTAHRAIPSQWCFDPPRAPGAAAIDNVFTGWTGRATVCDRTRNTSVTIEADRACSFLVVYIPAGRDYLAVEPVTHMTDAFNRTARGQGETGTRIVQRGAAFSTTMRLSVGPLA